MKRTAFGESALFRVVLLLGVASNAVISTADTKTAYIRISVNKNKFFLICTPCEI
ncbi:MAG: hypothetical protein AB7T10_02685 [bacterium]